MIRANSKTVRVVELTKVCRWTGETIETGLFRIVEVVGHSSQFGTLTITWEGLFSTIDNAKREVETVLKQKIDWTAT
jgi:hypothetical protein